MVFISLDFASWVCAQLNSSIKLFLNRNSLFLQNAETLHTYMLISSISSHPVMMPIHMKPGNTYETDISETWVYTDCWIKSQKQLKDIFTFSLASTATFLSDKESSHCRPISPPQVPTVAEFLNLTPEKLEKQNSATSQTLKFL